MPTGISRALRLQDRAQQFATVDGSSSGCLGLLLPADLVQVLQGRIFGMVAADVGVTVYSACARNFKRAGVVVRPLAGVKEKIPTYAAWVSDPPSKGLRRFTDLV